MFIYIFHYFPCFLVQHPRIRILKSMDHRTMNNKSKKVQNLCPTNIALVGNPLDGFKNPIPNHLGCRFFPVVNNGICDTYQLVIGGFLNHQQSHCCNHGFSGANWLYPLLWLGAFLPSKLSSSARQGMTWRISTKPPAAHKLLPLSDNVPLFCCINVGIRLNEWSEMEAVEKRKGTTGWRLFFIGECLKVVCFLDGMNFSYLFFPCFLKGLTSFFSHIVLFFVGALISDYRGINKKSQVK